VYTGLCLESGFKEFTDGVVGKQRPRGTYTLETSDTAQDRVTMTRHDASTFVESLYDSWAPLLVRYALHLTADRSLAEDFAQEAFLAIYRELRAGTLIENPRAWTLAVVRNLAGKRARSERRHGESLQPTEILDLMEAPEVLEPGPDTADIADLLPVLTPREIEVLLLRIESLKYREIATRLRISEKSVATLLARALHKLQVAAKAQVEGEYILARKIQPKP
jgi:RNA polymerase sigma factor (sigma-70 family)